jgi:hypothetical protein
MRQQQAGAIQNEFVYTIGALCYILLNNTRQGYAPRRILKPAGYFFRMEVESTSDKRYITHNTPAKPMPISVGMLKSRGFFIAWRQA